MDILTKYQKQYKYLWAFNNLDEHEDIDQDDVSFVVYRMLLEDFGNLANEHAKQALKDYK